MNLTKEQVTKLAEAQMALEGAESEARATAICMVPLSLPAKEHAAWSEREFERIVAPHREALSKLLRATGLSEKQWTKMWQSAKQEISGK